MPAAELIPETKASTIEEKDIYKGLGIALLLILVSKMGKNIDNNNNLEIEPIEDDLELLARVIHAEARGEPYDGQVGVGAVVINRLEHPAFPDTIRDVIYQKRQFSSVNDGQINLLPNDSSYRAANDAFNGIDPTGNAIYFYNPVKAKTIWWFEDNTVITTKIGNHVFAK